LKTFLRVTFAIQKSLLIGLGGFKVVSTVFQS